ncbi:DSS1/SEM1 family-domain-containing protein [Mrakia frigida]|uniref:proteasome regulatory particle lid subunit SEM1 n=1 Tax=Mrakia frigida TaxID=29902 RepID=UPI003FCBF980
MSAPASNTPTADASKEASSTVPKQQQEEEKKGLPQLGALEEDDEFEEFAQQDWDPSESSLAHLSSASTSAAADTAPTTSNLWEDNWDDDDVEEEFSKQLRAELEKQANGPSAMST